MLIYEPMLNSLPFFFTGFTYLQAKIRFPVVSSDLFVGIYRPKGDCILTRVPIPKKKKKKKKKPSKHT